MTKKNDETLVHDVKVKRYSSSNRILSFFRESYKMIIFFAIFFLIINYKLPYYIFVSGGITDLSDRFEIENGYKQKGSYNLSYVNEAEGNILTYVLSYIIPSWERVELENYQINENESVEDLLVRDKLSLTHANQTATILAYTRASKEIKYNNINYYVYYVSSYLESDKEIKIGDILLNVDNIKFDNFNEIPLYISSKNVGDFVSVEFKRNDDIYLTNVKIKEIDGKKVMGLSFYTIYDMEVNPKITFNFRSSESGSSAGLMTTLAIYDSLIEDDLTYGLKIAGTGAIDSEGNVIPIGGVEYKITGAYHGDADIFFVPVGENYNDALKIKNDRGYDIEIVAIKTLDDAINYLENLKNLKE